MSIKKALLRIGVVLLAVGMVGLTGCGGDGKSALVGRWNLAEKPTNGAPEAMDLLSDGTGIVDETAITYKTERGRLYITVFGMASLSYDFKVSGPRLTLVDDDGDVLKFLKKGHTLDEGKILNFLRDGVDVKVDSFTDSRNGQKYRTVKIGKQTWMGENLNFKSGNSWCYYDDESYCVKYGRLYDWETAKAACPSGWHLPSREEWSSLVATAGGDVAGKRLKSANGWDNDNNGTDILEFSALPGGYRTYDISDFAGNFGYWWSATESGNGQAYDRKLGPGSRMTEDTFIIDDEVGLSVRCIADGKGNPKQSKPPSTAAAGQTKQEAEPTAAEQTKPVEGVKIGNLTWTKQNLNIETPESWCYGNDNSNCAKYGRLYTWEAAKKVCASMGGTWRLPTDDDWDNLMTAVGGVRDGESYKHAGKKLKSKNGWINNGNGTDDYGFSALPGGGGGNGSFESGGNLGCWWSAMMLPSNRASEVYVLGMRHDLNDVFETIDDPESWNSVRCVTGNLPTRAQTPPPSAAPSASSANAAITKEEWAILMQDPDFKAADKRLVEAYKAAVAAMLSDDSKQVLVKDQRTWAAKREQDAFAHANKGSPEYKRFFINKGSERIAELQEYTVGR